MSTNSISIPESPYYNLDDREISYELTDCYDEKFCGDTIEEAVEKLSQAYTGNLAAPSALRGLSVKMIIYMPARAEVVSARVRELNADRKAKAAAAQLQQSLEFYFIMLDDWQKQVDALNAEAGDYTPEGFNKRWKALQAQKPVKP